MTQLIAGKFRVDELATHRLKPVRTPIQRGPFTERLESKCGALAGRPSKINIDRPATSELFKNPVYPAKSKQAPSACFCWRNGRDDELVTRRLKPARTPIQRVLFAERLESKCGALAGRPLKINIDRPATSELFENPVYPAKSKQAPSAYFCWRNGREVSGRRIGYSQAKACSYADPAGPLYRVQAERQKLRCSIFFILCETQCEHGSHKTKKPLPKQRFLPKSACRGDWIRTSDLQLPKLAR